MNRVQVKNLISLILNLAMAVLVAVAVSAFFTGEGLSSGMGNMDAGGFRCLIFFTNDSNILAALCGLFLVPFNLKSLVSGKNAIPHWALFLKYLGANAIAVTFMVVMCFLGPIQGYSLMLEGNCFLLHLVCPLISIVSFCFIDSGMVVTKKQAWIAVIPPMIYGTIYTVTVVIMKIWDDFYNLNSGGRWYISYVTMGVVSFTLATVLRILHNASEKREQNTIAKKE